MNILKYNVIEKLNETGLVAIVRDKTEEDAKIRTRAVRDGGVSLLEITMNTPGALNIISDVAKEIKEKGLDSYIGAGSVLDPESARAAILAGAQFIISPNFKEETAKVCNRYGIPYMPGVLTPTEIVTALENGCDIVKIFPASAMGKGYIKAVSAPLGNVKCVAVGGVNLNNIADYFQEGAFAVALGNGLTHPTKGAPDYEEIKAHAKNIVAKVNESRA